MTIVGFHGQLGSGKDLAAERLARLVSGLPHMRVAFADKLKQSAAALFGIDPDDWNRFKNDPDVKIYLADNYREIGGAFGDLQELNIVAELTARQFLQRYGTEAHRDVFDYDFWVNAAFQDIPEKMLVTVTDVRFPNEVEAIHKRGGVVIHILGETQVEAAHASEQSLEGCDFTVDNSVRNDGYSSLDDQLYRIASMLNLPL